MRAVTGRPIKFLGAGEKLDALEVFHPDRIAGRILGMGDIVGLVEKAMETIEVEEAERLAKRMEKGKFDLEDMRKQFAQVKKMGDLKGILGMLPGIGKIANQLKDANIDDKMIGRQEAIILSMTPAERKNPDLIKASRKKRIAAGCGMNVQDVNKLLKQYQQMADMMKKVGKMGQKGLMRHGIGGLLPPGSRFGR
jgi:signal recognition particle subunit SRP54